LQNKIFVLLRAGTPPIWLAVFLYLALKGASTAPPANAALFALAFAGAGYFLWFAPAQTMRLVREHSCVLGTAVLLATAILISEAAGALRGLAPLHPLPPQAGLLLCLPALALFLADGRKLRAVVALFCAICIWHWFALPIEAVLGAKVSWHPVQLFARTAGPLNYQASGLALQSYFFPGLFLPLFYLAWGPIYEKRVFPDLAISRRSLLVLPLLWLVPVACVQSRSAFAGAMGAALLALIASSRVRQWRTWFAGMLLVGLAAAIYWYLFAENKTGAELRMAYLKLYLRESLDWRWLATGRSLYLETAPRMMVPGSVPLHHSHNDIVQVLYSWGLPGLLAYLAFAGALLKLVYSRFWVHREYWPGCALIALFPSMVTDLGLQHFEKAAFLVLLTAFCIACPPKGAAGSTIKP
jgi:O-antigen ligase